MNDEATSIFEDIPSFEQNATLGECSDSERKSFTRFVHKLPLSRAGMNYEILSCPCYKLSRSKFVQSVINRYSRWLHEEWSKFSEENSKKYTRAINYIYTSRTLERLKKAQYSFINEAVKQTDDASVEGSNEE